MFQYSEVQATLPVLNNGTALLDTGVSAII